MVCHCLAALRSPSMSLFSSVLVPLALRLPWAVRALRVGAAPGHFQSQFRIEEMGIRREAVKKVQLNTFPLV